MSKRIYLPGPVIVGLCGLFDESFGDASTAKPYSRVTPSRIGSAILPFPCPRCSSTIDFSDPEVRKGYLDERDPRKPNYFCPRCGCRFFLNEKGTTGGKVDSRGAAAAIVERVTCGSDGLIEVQRETVGGRSLLGLVLSARDYVHGCDVLGSI